VLLGRAFVRSIHAYVCKDPPTRKKVRDILKNAGLEEFSGLATPEGAFKAAVIYMVPKLIVVLGSPFPAFGIAIVAIVIAVLGLDAICSLSVEEISNRKREHKRV
jgi:hypothetical protein